MNGSKSWMDVMTLLLASIAFMVNGLGMLTDVLALPGNPLFQPLIAGLHVAALTMMVYLFQNSLRRLREDRQADRMNIRVVRDGQELRCRLYHMGVEDGIDYWLVLDQVMLPGDTLISDAVPHGTGIRIQGVNGS